MSSLSAGLRPEWLALREGADAAARAAGLLDPLRAWLATHAGGSLLIRDLGCGTGSMGRWLSSRLPGPQHWVLHDREPDLLARAVDTPPKATEDGRLVSVSAQLGDLTALGPIGMSGTSLVTTSALLDLLTAAEIESLAAACRAAGCPALLTLSVLGRVVIDPADPLDMEIMSAFNDHQRRDRGGRAQLGPTAFAAASAAFGTGFTVHRAASPWLLDAGDRVLIEEWLTGWVAAAAEQRPDLAEQAAQYLGHRHKLNAAGELRVTVEHADLLALPEGS